MKTKRKKSPPVSIIILNYNGQQFLEGCFSSIKKINYPQFETIMVDDNSSDKSVSFTKSKFPWVKIIKNKENLGAPTGFNQAIKEANYELVVKADNDIIVDKNWLAEMVAVLQKNPKIGIVGSKILHYGSDEIQDIGSNLDRFGYQMNYYTLKGLPEDETKPQEVFYVSGCSMLFKKSLFEKVGGFDGKFFLYKDDLDLCWRFKLLGFKTVTAFTSKMYHLSGVVQGGKIELDEKGRYHTTAKKRYFGERNTLRTLLKNYSLISLVKVLPPYFAIILAEIVFFSFLGQFKVSRAYLEAVWWNLVNLSETLDLRRQIQTLRTVSDPTIMKKMIRGSSKLKNLTSIGVPQFK